MLRFSLALLVSADWQNKPPKEWSSTEQHDWKKDHEASWKGEMPWKGNKKDKSWSDNSWQKDASWTWKEKEPAKWTSNEKKSWETTHSSTKEKPWESTKKNNVYGGTSGGWGSTDTWKPSSTKTAETADTSSDGLSGGAIAGIVIGCIAGVAIIAFLVVYFFMGNDRDLKFDEPRQPEQRKSVKVPVGGDGKGGRTPTGKGGRTPGGKGGRDASPANKLSPGSPKSFVGGGKSPGKKSPRKSQGEKKLGETKKTSFPPMNTRDFPKE